MIHTLPTLPNAKGLTARALRTALRKPGENPRLPGEEVRVASVRVDGARLLAYRELCGFAASEFLPLTFPQVLAAPLHLWLMLRPEFPFPMMGIVHVRNRFTLQQPMPADAAYDVRAAFGQSRRTHQGFEFDIVTEFSDVEGQVVYQSLMTPLYRMKSETPRPPSRPQVPAPQLAEYRSLDVPADMGRRYAPVGGDFNPIHLYAATAKLFGFPRAIAHGMWSVARVAGLLEEAGGQPLTRLDVQFRQPLLLPGKTALKFSQQDGRTDFALLSRSSDKVHFTGSAGP
jgi:acyl dehydratase